VLILRNGWIKAFNPAAPAVAALTVKNETTLRPCGVGSGHWPSRKPQQRPGKLFNHQEAPT
jgi:hypothetical protein